MGYVHKMIFKSANAHFYRKKRIYLCGLTVIFEELKLPTTKCEGENDTIRKTSI